jgi:hypothetical protein
MPLRLRIAAPAFNRGQTRGVEVTCAANINMFFIARNGLSLELGCP